MIEVLNVTEREVDEQEKKTERGLLALSAYSPSGGFCPLDVING